jgi:hypothetical protein
MGWLDALEDPRPILAVYSGKEPSLTSADVHEVTLHRDGPTMTLRFDLAAFPEDPPAKWRKQRCNRAQVSLMLVGLSDVTIHRWSVCCRTDLALTKVPNGVRLSASSEGIELQACARSAVVSRLSAYCLDTSG